MVFERFKTDLLKARLQQAQGVSKFKEERAKKKIAKIKKEQKLRDTLLKERLKIKAEQDKLKTAIKKAKQIKLSPSDKKAVMRRMQEKRIRDEKLRVGVNKIGRNIFKGLQATAKFIDKIDQNLNERPPKRRRKPKTVKKKKVVKKKTSKRMTKSKK